MRLSEKCVEQDHVNSHEIYLLILVLVHIVGELAEPLENLFHIIFKITPAHFLTITFAPAPLLVIHILKADSATHSL